MRLYLVQHGDSLPKDVNPDRPLSDQGRHDVERLAAFLAKRRLRVSRLYHSGKTRAEQTAELLGWAVDREGQAEARDGLAPNDPTEPVAQEAADWQDDAMIVGHLPFVDRLASRLVAGREDAGVAFFVPGTAVCLEQAEEGGWGVAWMVRPELLPE
jgi:phosphohistidine phosphatase